MAVVIPHVLLLPFLPLSSALFIPRRPQSAPNRRFLITSYLAPKSECKRNH